MWDHKKMPNPIAAKRLTELGCKVKYQKSHLLEPREIRTPEDIRPNSKKGKLDRKPIWIVEIQMPKKVAFDIYKGYMDKMKNDYEDSKPTESSGVPAIPAPQVPPVPAGAAPAPAAAPGAVPAGGAV
jgi:hypothetical protein